MHFGLSVFVSLANHYKVGDWSIITLPRVISQIKVHIDTVFVKIVRAEEYCNITEALSLCLRKKCSKNLPENSS